MELVLSMAAMALVILVVGAVAIIVQGAVLGGMAWIGYKVFKKIDKVLSK
jgi:hypothetical protein